MKYPFFTKTTELVLSMWTIEVSVAKSISRYPISASASRFVAGIGAINTAVAPFHSWNAILIIALMIIYRTSVGRVVGVF